MNQANQNVQQLPSGKFAVTDSAGNRKEYDTREAAEAAIKNTGNEDRPQTQRPDPSRS